MNVLGIYGAFGWNSREDWIHDSGATLFINGKHVCSIGEERLSKIKYDGDYPQKSIDYCLSSGNITKEDINIVVIPSMANITFYNKLKEGEIHTLIRDNFPNAEIKFISHHTSHAYSSIFSCEYNEGSFVTLDGAGSAILDSIGRTLSVEDSSVGYFNKKKNIFRLFLNPSGINNFGHYYQSWSHHIYCKKTGQQIEFHDSKYRETFPGKVMGLSAYGSREKVSEYEKEYSLNYEGIPGIVFNAFPNNDIGFFLSQYKKLDANNQATLLQKTFEDAGLEYFKDLKEKGYLEDNLCLSGGVFLNVLLNTVLKENNIVKNIHIPPFTNDSGLHFGAACYGVHANNEQVILPQNIALLGKEYSNEEIEKVLSENSFMVEYKKYDNFDDLCDIVSEKLNNNEIVAWFQGRSEMGPRALGSRSILMNTSNKDNKEILNERIKHREYWRPFAGVILQEYHKKYFNEKFATPYMLYSQEVKKNKVKDLAAITHKDGTCRIQTVNEEMNSKLTTLLKRYHDLSGIPALLNTSFNDNGQPICETPNDAIKTLLNIDIDYLAIGNYIVSRIKK
jgi:carbamoyltransferase